MAADGQMEIGLDVPPPEVPPSGQPLSRLAVDEVLCVARNVERLAARADLLWCSGTWQWPVAAVPEIVGKPVDEIAQRAA
jgi:hypothetical protein